MDAGLGRTPQGPGGLDVSKSEALNDSRIDDEAMLADTVHPQGAQLTLSACRKCHVRVRAV